VSITHDVSALIVLYKVSAEFNSTNFPASATPSGEIRTRISGTLWAGKINQFLIEINYIDIE
jgi:hypothetical protein